MRKQLILTTMALALLVTGSFAQSETATREKLMLGFKLGLNLSNVYDEQGENFDADAKFGMAVGAFVAIPIGKYLGVQPELLFSQKGFQATGSLLGTNYSFTRTTNFIDVPIFLAIKPTEVLTLLVGPQYSYLIKQTDAFASGNNTTEQVKEFENDNIRKNILSFALGADINLNHLVLGGRACWDVQTNNGDGTSSTPRYKNVWYQATIGYRFF